MHVNSKFWSAWKEFPNFGSQDSLSLFPSYEFLLILKHDIALCVLTLNFSSPHFIIEKNWNLARRSFWRDFFHGLPKQGFQQQQATSRNLTGVAILLFFQNLKFLRLCTILCMQTLPFPALWMYLNYYLQLLKIVLS